MRHRLPLFVWIGLLVLAALCCAANPVRSAESAAATALWTEVTPVHSGTNLIPNGGFERLDPDGMPTGWRWVRRNTDATCTVVTGSMHMGERALHFTNGTAYNDQTYGVFFRPEPIPLTVGHKYTLSCWVRGDNPGDPWFGTWRDLSLHLVLPRTGGAWQRVSLTFTATPRVEKLYLIFVTERPTSGFDVDDLKLEEGEAPTPDADSARVVLSPLNSTRWFNGDVPLQLPWSITAPGPLADLEAEVSAEPSGVSARGTLALPGGLAQLTTRLPIAGWVGMQQVRLRLSHRGRVLAQSGLPLRFLSGRRLEDRVQKLQTALIPIRTRLARLDQAGEDSRYPRVSLAVCERFLPFVRDDLQHGSLQQATDELAELEQIRVGLEQQVAGAETGGVHLPRVPQVSLRRRPRIQHASLLVPAEGRGQQGQRPVFEVGFGHFGQVRADIERFPALGINRVQVEVGPMHLFPAPDRVDLEPVRELVRLLDRAERAGVGVDLLISPHYLPDWMLELHPELKRRRDGFLNYCLHAASGQEFLRHYLQVLLPPLREKRALHSICLSNEPANLEEPCPDAERAWREWLRHKHGDLQILNRCWHTSYQNWEELPLPNPLDHSVLSRPTPLLADWVRFNADWFSDWHEKLREAVHHLLPGVPVHIKATTWSFMHTGEVSFGMDATRLASVSDLNGQDAVIPYSYGEGEFAQDFAPSLYAIDAQRSLRDAPVVNSEAHLIPDRDPRPIPGAHLRAALWQAAVHGQSAATLWVWERTHRPGDPAYASILSRPECVEAVGKTCLDLNRLAVPLTRLQQQAPEVGILESTSAKIWDGDAPRGCAEQLYTALSFLGLRVGVVTERQLEQGTAPRLKVLFLPDIFHLSDRACATLHRYAGRLVCVGSARPNSNEYSAATLDTPVVEGLHWDPATGTWRDLWEALQPRLQPWHVSRPAVVQTPWGTPEWGIAAVAVPSRAGGLVALCNYRNKAVTCALEYQGRAFHGQDLITGTPVTHLIMLAPLQVALLQETSTQSADAKRPKTRQPRKEQWVPIRRTDQPTPTGQQPVARSAHLDQDRCLWPIDEQSGVTVRQQH